MTKTIATFIMLTMLSLGGFGERPVKAINPPYSTNQSKDISNAEMKRQGYKQHALGYWYK